MSRNGGPAGLKGKSGALLVVVAAAAVLGATLAGAQSRNARQDLQAVRKEIKAVEARLARQSSERDASARALRASETEIAAASRKLADVRARLGEQQAQRRTLGREAAQATERLAKERDALGRQVRASYMSGREEVFKLLLSQESPASLGRMMVYYDYFNRARSERIAAVRSDLTKLAELDAASAAVAQQLTALEAAQASELAALDRARDERRAVLAKLDAGIKDDKAAASKLRGEERRLTDLIKQLAEATAGFPVDSDEPFARLKGKLAWPVQGRIAGDYGQPRDGGPVKWNGVLLEAKQGADVRAIYRGRVVFADWLSGLGLLAIVDHGGGYMSLYGHNEALLKEVGDPVEPGEAIARVGDSGGQARSGVYFEIRQNGAPVNPHPWIARRPSGR
jgi:septal ring factor EnvC (AmiA/AmiB activator)